LAKAAGVGKPVNRFYSITWKCGLELTGIDCTVRKDGLSET
jgi:hypothetical protein